jgi:uncharacterized delta-60 repeat protein
MKFGTKGSLLLKNFEVSRGAILSDGNILLAGDNYPSNSSNRDLILVKTSPSGKLLTSFGNKGIFQTKMGVKDNNLVQQYPNQILTNNNDDIFLFGSTYSQYNKIGKVAKLNSSGKPDSNFGNSGITSISIDDNDYTVIKTGFVNSDGSILIAGSTQKYGFDNPKNPHKEIKNSAFLARLDKNGSLDPTFNSNGFKYIKITNTSYESSSIAAVLKDADGNFLIIDEITSGNDSDLGEYLIKLKPNLDMDSTFGEKGILKINFNPGFKSLNVIDAKIIDNQIFLNGYLENNDPQKVSVSNSQTQGSESHSVGFSARLSLSGKLDPTYGDKGVLLENDEKFTNYWLGINKLTSQKYLISGFVWTGPNSGAKATFKLVKSDGQVDTSFGSNGQYVFTFKNGKVMETMAVVDPSGYLYLSTVNNSCSWCGTEVKKYSFKP